MAERTPIIITGPTRAAVQQAITRQINAAEESNGTTVATFRNPYMVQGGTWRSEGLVIHEPAEVA